MEMTTEPTALAVRDPAQIAPLTIQAIIAQKKLVSQCVSELMHENEHFGVIPGTEKKDDRGKDVSKRVLFKSGADLLCSLFQLVADYEQLEVIRTPTLIYYRLKCTLTSASSGIRRGSGLGSCNSHEEKYIRAAGKKCPQCNKETVLRSKPREGDRGEPGWFCWAKKGGCGANFVFDAAAIVDQGTGIKDPADLDNTILKMAAKRSRVDAVLTVTGASDFFTQDVEDLTEREAEYIPPPAKASAAPSPKGVTTAAPPASAQTSTNAPSPTTKTSGTIPLNSTATKSSAASIPSPAKPNGSGAADIVHDGVYITEGQLKVLHITRREVGGQYCTDGGKDEDDARSLWRSKVLAVYRDKDGSRITSSKQLSKAQANHLIDRLTKYAARTQATKAQRDAETNVIDIMPREPGSDDAPEEEMATPDDLADLETAAGDRWGDSYRECFPEWLKGAFDYDTVIELRRQEAIDATRMIREGR